jgi:hypothetical protein
VQHRNLFQDINFPKSYLPQIRGSSWHNDCYRWRGDDELNDRPVGKPQEEGMMNIASNFSLSKKPRFVDPVGKSQTQEGDAC